MFDFSINNIIWSVSILIVAVFLSVLSYKLYKKNLNINKLAQKQIYMLAEYLIWSSSIYAISTILIKGLSKNVLINTKYFHIMFIDLPLLLGLIVLALLFYQILKNLFKYISDRKSKIRLLLSASIIVWAIFLSLTLKIIMKDYSVVTDFELFKIKKISVTVYDIYFSILVIILTEALLKGLRKYFDFRVKTEKLEFGTATAIFQLIKYFVWVFVIIIILQSGGFDVTILLAGSAALLVGLGIGIQHVFSDIVSGIILLFERKISAGQIVDVDNVIGKVLKIGIRTTEILTREDIVMQIPNSKFITERFENLNDEFPLSRFDVKIGVAYGSDVKLVIKTLEECASSHSKVAEKPKPNVLFSDFGDSALLFTLYFWTDENFRFEGIKSDIRIMIDEKFRELGITIPFPQRDVHLYQK